MVVTTYLCLIACLQMVLKCADIGHLAAGPRTHRRWAFQLEEEFFRQVPSAHLCVFAACWCSITCSSATLVQTLYGADTVCCSAQRLEKHGCVTSVMSVLIADLSNPNSILVY